MNDLELEKRIAANRADYEAYFGKPCKHFVCPILGRDEDVEMCRGHMVTLAQSDIWIPQRKDVDNFYGSVVEADLATVVEDRGKDPWQLLLDPEKRPKHRFKMAHDGKPVGYYFPKPSHEPVKYHIRLEVRNGDDETICNIGIKKSASEFLAAENTRLDLVVERDFRPPVLAAMLKAAHLTMFRMLGYDHVDSPGGRFVADILKVFFEKHGGSHSAAKGDVDPYFARFNSMVAPLVAHGEGFLKGTAEDNVLIACHAATQGIFAIGVIVKVNQDRFCVFLPSDQAIDVYFSFLNEPPPFVTARIMQFCDGSDGKGQRWEAAPSTRQILLNQQMPEPEGAGANAV